MSICEPAPTDPSSYRFKLQFANEEILPKDAMAFIIHIVCVTQ